MFKTTLAALGLAALSVGAQAATVTSDFSNPLERTEIHQSGTLNLFNSALGTLTGATLTIRTDATFAFTGYNKSASTQNAIITANTSINWDSTLAGVDALVPKFDDFMLAHSTVLESYLAQETKAFGLFDESLTKSFDLSSMLGSLQSAGGGTFALGCDSLSGLVVRGGGANIDTTQDTFAGCGAEIVYQYDQTTTPEPVSEPISLALVGAGLAAMSVLRRRKNRK